MFRLIVQYFRSCFCKHDLDIPIVVIRHSDDYALPIGAKHIYRCKKCGYVKKIKL